MTPQHHNLVRKGFFSILWTFVFFLLTSTCCLVYFSSTAYEFADLAMMDGTLDESNQPMPDKEQFRNTGARMAYAYATMHESDIFAGLFIFSFAVSLFAGYVGILPGTDDESMQFFMERGAEDASMLALSPYCPNCGTSLQQDWNFCSQCGQERTVAQELTLGNFVRSTIPDILNIDGKFFHTVQLLLTKPGFLTLEYLQAKKASYTLPTQLYFVIAAAFFVVSINLDFSTDVLYQQAPQLAELITQKAQENNLPIEIIKQRVDNTLENFIPIYTFFMVIMFAACLKVLYPHWYYVEHLVFSLHFIAYFLILWMGLIIVAARFPALDNFAVFLPLPYLFFCLKNVHFSSAKWKFFPAMIFFFVLFLLYIAFSLYIGILVL
ncbi:MAG: DUF3667 domain-containing protein [Candidatus Kapaibacterium sp.]|nr:MAG: DUF3667 domain-containing protein [Candidatus Kapabacteria bacterium]